MKLTRTRAAGWTPRGLRLSPDEIGSTPAAPDGASTGTPDGAKNTGAGDARQPDGSGGLSDRERQAAFNAGRGKGISTALLELGFNTDNLEEAKRLHSARSQGQSDKKPPQDAAADDRYQQLASQYAAIETQVQQLTEVNKQLSAQADHARKLAIKAAAIEAGVGAGQQAEAFYRIYGDRFGLDQGQLGAKVDVGGTSIVVHERLAKVLGEALEESPFLLAPRGGGGAPALQGRPPSRPEAPDAHSAWQAEMSGLTGKKPGK